MALGTNGTAGSLSCTSTPATAQIKAGAGAVICARATTASANAAQVSIPGLHNSSDFAEIEPGDTRYYVLKSTDPTITYKSSGTATLLVDVVRR
jgi:hypothetical protein